MLSDVVINKQTLQRFLKEILGNTAILYLIPRLELSTNMITSYFNKAILFLFLRNYTVRQRKLQKRKQVSSPLLCSFTILSII